MVAARFRSGIWRTDNVLELPAQVTSAGTVTWDLTDRMGSLHNVVSSTGAVIDTIAYDGFGNITSESDSANGGAYKYDGYRCDTETGLYKPDSSDRRYYNPLVGLWMTLDPMEFIAGRPNLFVYVENNPTNTKDPSGNFGCPTASPLGLFVGFAFADEKPKVRTDKQCCTDARVASKVPRVFLYLKENFMAGMVICCDGRFVPCVFLKDESSSEFVNTTLNKCRQLHEERHVKDAEMFKKCEPNADFIYPASPKNKEASDMTEKSAYGTEIECIIRELGKCDKLEKTDVLKKACKDGLITVIMGRIAYANQAHGFNPADAEQLNKDLYTTFVKAAKDAGVKYDPPKAPKK